MIGKHATTGNPCTSPFVNISNSYMKQSTLLWANIQQIVKENCSADIGLNSPEMDMMEQLLRNRGN
jgi:hypothetical protein